MCQRKYALDHLTETGMANYKPLKLPMSQQLKLMDDSDLKLDDPNQFRRLVGKLIYLTITRLDISYSVQILNQFVTSPTTEHMNTASHGLRYLKMLQALVLCLLLILLYIF